MSNLLKDLFNTNKRKASTRPTKEHKAKAKDYLQQINDFEKDRVALAKSSAKKAWMVAGVSCAITALAVLAIGSQSVAIKELKQVDPYIPIYNASTGTMTIARPLANAKKISYEEALDKYWLNAYILLRNGYEWETIQHNFNVVKLMSSDKVFNAYNRYIRGDKSPVKVFAENKNIVVAVEEITFLPPISNEHTLAQVRFSRTVETNSGENELTFKTVHWNATVTFDYLAEIKTEGERRVNPLGFRVTSYREDEVLK